jgi:hypothetical protein
MQPFKLKKQLLHVYTLNNGRTTCVSVTFGAVTFDSCRPLVARDQYSSFFVGKAFLSIFSKGHA